MKKALSLIVGGFLAVSLLLVMGQTRPEELWPYAQGTAYVETLETWAILFASPGAGLATHIEAVVVTCETAGTGGTAAVQLVEENDARVIWQMDADAVGSYSIPFGPRGFRAALNVATYLRVVSAGTAQASCLATGIAHVTR